MNKPSFIIEVANTHDGDFKYLLELIGAFSKYSKGFGMKFQPMHPDKIATKDYHEYNIFQQLYFDKNQWGTAIGQAFETKHIWLDIFDTYGIEVLQDNLEKVYGIKFQSSVLYNFEVLEALSGLDLSTKRIILNVAAQSIENIRETVNRVSNQLKPQEILLEFGYQAYPTTLEDSGYSKIKVIKENFNNRIVFADHVDGKTEDALWLPVIVAMNGVDVIEKHVMLDNRQPKYDYFSSLAPSRFSEMVNKVSKYHELINQPFINQKEQEYLNITIMIPVLKRDKPVDSLINFEKDLMYRRTGKKGLNLKEIGVLQNSSYVLAVNKKAGESLMQDDFKKIK